MTRIMEALAARMDRVRKGEKGFTLIELLVVVIIIGILAAIAIPVYIGVQNNAKDSGVKSDVGNLKTAIISLQTTSGAVPGAIDAKAAADLTDAQKEAGATMGSDTTRLQYASDGTTFCIIGTSSTNKVFYATDSAGVSTDACTLPTPGTP